MSHAQASSPTLEGDDAALLRRYAETRSEDAFAQFARRHVDLVYSTALRCVAGDSHLAQDVTQEVFVIVARRAAALAGHRALEGWLYTTARYEAIHAVRREQRRRGREQKAHLMNELHFDPAAEPDWRQSRPLLDDAMDELNTPDREAVVMRFFLQRSFREISGQLGLNEDAARRRVDRALEKLQRVLERRGVASTSTAMAGLLSAHAVAAAPAGMAGLATRAALAASGTAGIGAGLFQFMGVAKSGAGIVSTVLLIAALALATYEIRARQAAETALADARAPLPAPTRSARIVDERRAAGADTAARDPLAEGEAFLARHPEVRQAIIARSNAKLNYRWGALYRALALTPAQIERLQALQREGETYRAGTGADGKTLSFRLGTGRARSEIETEARTLLGADGLRQLEAFAATIPAREFTLPLASALYFTDTPLTAAQADQVTRLLTQNRTSPHGLRTAQFDWNTVMASAAEMLSPPQLAALDGLRAQDLVQTAFNGARLSETPAAK